MNPQLAINFSLYFFVSLAALVLFKVIYSAITPHDEWKLIKEEKNTAAGIAFSGAIVGYAIALHGVVSNSVSLLDLVIWAAIAMVAQLLAFAIVRFIFMPKIVSRIENGEVSAGVVLAAISVAVGLLNSASMTY